MTTATATLDAPLATTPKARRTRKPVVNPVVQSVEMAVEAVATDAGNLTVGQFDLTRHNGYLNVHNPATGNQRTFSIETVTDHHDGLAGKRIIRLLIGMDRDDPSHWRGFAFADDFGCHVWKRFRGTDKPSEYEKFARMLSESKRYADKGVRYLISGTCRKCNRLLTNPASIATGLGPICSEKVGL